MQKKNQKYRKWLRAWLLPQTYLRMGAAVAAILSELADTFTLKDKQRQTGGGGHICLASLAPIESLEPLQSGSKNPNRSATNVTATGFV